MKIQNLLTEGLIKIPTDVINSVMTSVASVVFSYFIEFHEVMENTDNVETLKMMMKVFQRKYSPFELVELDDEHMENGFQVDRIVHIDPAVFDPRYKKTSQTRKYPIMVTAGVNLGDEDTLASYGVSPKTGRVVLTVDIQENDYFKVLQAPQGIKFLKVFMEILEQAVEHELMHFVQNKLLGQDIIKAASTYTTDDGKTDLLKYYQSDIEFGPSIKSAFAQFAGDIKSAMKTGMMLSRQELDKEVLAFTQPGRDGKITSMSNFFKILYNNDKEKWKKAVKYFHSLVLKNIDTLTSST